MKTEINNTPSVIWNGKSDRVIIAVHGKMHQKRICRYSSLPRPQKKKVYRC